MKGTKIGKKNDTEQAGKISAGTRVILKINLERESASPKNKIMLGADDTTPPFGWEEG